MLNVTNDLGMTDPLNLFRAQIMTIVDAILEGFDREVHAMSRRRAANGSFKSGAMLIDIDQSTGRAQLRRASDLLSRYVPPLYTDENRRPVHAGSAFIVKAQGHYFLVTAAHVLDRLADGNLYFYVTPRTVRAVEGEGYTTPGSAKDRRKDDRLDVGVVCLRNGGYPPYPLVDKAAIDIHELGRC